MNPSRAGAVAVLVVMVLAWCGATQIDDQFARCHRVCELLPPDSDLVDPLVVTPSSLGKAMWIGSEPLEASLGPIEPGEIIKLNLRTTSGRQGLRVVVGGNPLAVIEVDGSWRQSALVASACGKTLRLERTDPGGGPIHISRVSVCNTVGGTSGVFELYFLHEPGPGASDGVWVRNAGVAGGVAVAVLLLLTVWAARHGASWSAAVVEGSVLIAPATVVVATFALLRIASSLRVIYPSSTFLVMVVTASLATVLVRNRRAIAARVRVGKRIIVKAAASVDPLIGWMVFPARWSALTYACVAGAGGLGLALLACLAMPASPFEWDEVLFMRALDIYDVASYSPHAPGYPLYVGLARVVRLVMNDPMRSLQVVSVAGALLALGVVFLLGLRLGRSRGASLLAVLVTVAIPAFAFSANVGMSDALGGGATALAVLALSAVIDDPSRGWRLPSAAVASALALSVRPQLLLVIVGVGVWAIAATLVRRRWSTLVTAVCCGSTVLAVCWAPPIMITGWDRYLAAIRSAQAWMARFEAGNRLPGAPLKAVLENWLVHPFGTPVMAVGFWFLVAAGALCWWSAGRRRLVGVATLGACGYLFAATWIMDLSTAVRYIVPITPFLGLLVAGVATVRRCAIRIPLLVLALVVVVAQLAWAMPVYVLRSTGPAPSWQALTWIREHASSSSTTVVYNGVLAPHAEYVLGRAGFKLIKSDTPMATRLRSPGALDVAPLHELGDRSTLFAATWESLRLRQLSRNRYYSCGVALH